MMALEVSNFTEKRTLACGATYSFSFNDDNPNEGILEISIEGLIITHIPMTRPDILKLAQDALTIVNAMIAAPLPTLKN